MAKRQNHVVVQSLLLLGVLALAARLPAQDEFARSFTLHSVGDTIRVFQPDSHRFYVTAFVDASACFTCDGTLEAMQETLAGKHNLRVSAFFCEADGTFASKYADVHGWKFGTVADPISAYEQAYGVRALPFYYLTDESGSILVMDKCGGVATDLDSIDALLTRIEHADPGGQKSRGGRALSLQESNGAAVLVGPEIEAVRSLSGRYAILDRSLKTVFLTDSTLRVLRKHDLTKSRYPYIMPLDIDWIREDSAIVISSTSIKPIGGRSIYTLNVLNGTLHQLAFDEEAVCPNARLSHAVRSVDHSSIFAVGMNPVEITASDPIPSTVIELGKNGGLLRTFGAIDPQYLSDSSIDLMDSRVVVDAGGTIYEWQDFTKHIYVYTPDGERLKTIDITFGPQFRGSYPDSVRHLAAKHHKTLPDWIYLNSNLSEQEALLIDRKNRELYLVYGNPEYPPGVDDPHSAQAKVSYFIHGIPLDHPQTQERLDWQVPDGYLPIEVSGQTLLAHRIRNGMLEIVSLPLGNGADFSNSPLPHH